MKGNNITWPPRVLGSFWSQAVCSPLFRLSKTVYTRTRVPPQRPVWAYTVLETPWGHQRWRGPGRGPQSPGRAWSSCAGWGGAGLGSPSEGARTESAQRTSKAARAKCPPWGHRSARRSSVSLSCLSAMLQTRFPFQHPFPLQHLHVLLFPFFSDILFSFS